MLPDESLPMPAEWRELLEQAAAGVFRRRPTRHLFMALACGLILADRGTVTGMAAAAGIGRQWRRACWFFASAAWDADALGLAVARLIVKYLLSEGDPLVVAVDGTFFRRWGRRVAEARWAYDGSAQGGKKIAFGNTWVILALVVRLPFCPSPVALPALFRLWRGKGTPSQVQLAGQLTELLVKAFPGREVHGTGDAAFHGEPLVIEGATWTTRLPASAVIHGPKPPPSGKRGRPREKGDRIGKCKDAAAIADWQDVTVRIYGKEQKVQAAAWPGLWYGSFGSAPGQLVLMREPDSRVLLAVAHRALQRGRQAGHRRRRRLQPHREGRRAHRPLRVPRPVPHDLLVRDLLRPGRRPRAAAAAQPVVPDQGHARSRRHARRAPRRAHRSPNKRHQRRCRQVPENHQQDDDQRDPSCLTQKHECHEAPEYSLACGASTCSPAGQMVQPCAKSAAHSRFVQCPHRYNSP